MESIVVFADGMDIDPSDFNNLEAFAQSSLDHVVADAVTQNNRFAGLTVSKTGTTTIGIIPGRIYQGGVVYASNNSIVQDFLQSLPVASLKNVLVIAIGNTQAAAAIPREFLIDETTGASEPRVVSVQQDRVAAISYAYGVESPTPVDPLIQTAYTVIARVVLSTAGIQSVQMLSANQLDNVDDLAQRTTALEAFEALVEPQISTLASDIARLSNLANQPSPTQTIIAQMLTRIATLEAKTGVPSTSQSSAADYFLDTTSSDTTNPLYLAQVEEGIRYAYDGQNEIPIALFNPIDPAATTSGGVIFPAYTRQPRLTVGPAIADVQVSAYTYQTTTMVQETMALSRTRYGASFYVCSNSAYWQSGQYDPATGIFTLPDGETFNASFTGASYSPNYDPQDHLQIRLTEFWVDSWNVPYWQAVTTTNTVTGAQVAETFLCGQDFWLESVELTFTFIDTTQPVTVVVCKCSPEGTPDLTSVISQSTVQQANLQITPKTTVFAWTPAYLQAGNRYAIVVITSGNHKIATAPGTAFSQGNFFELTGGGFAAGDLTKHLCFTLNACLFSNPTTILTLQPLQLSGGLTDIDITAGTIAPASTTLTYQVCPSGSTTWISLSAATAGQLNAGGNLPALLQFRCIMLGTPDIMPAINASASNIIVSRPKTSAVHISTVRTPPSPTSSVTVIETYGNFNPQYHSCNCVLLSGAGYGTVTQPSSFTTIQQADGTTKRTYVFNLPSPLSSYKIETQMTTQTALITQFVGSRIDYCL